MHFYPLKILISLLFACDFSVFSGSAWTWMESRKEYYLHQFYSEQPDLNFRNSAVKKEMDEVLRFWLRKGVAGFRLDAVGFLMESKVNKNGYYDDEPPFISRNPLDDPDPDPNGHGRLRHIQYDTFHQYNNNTTNHFISFAYSFID